jgi:hypothetical protein
LPYKLTGPYPIGTLPTAKIVATSKLSVKVRVESVNSPRSAKFASSAKKRVKSTPTKNCPPRSSSSRCRPMSRERSSSFVARITDGAADVEPGLPGLDGPGGQNYQQNDLDFE